MEKVRERGRKLIATHEPTVVAKPFFDAIVVEDSKGDGCLPNPASPNQRNWSEPLCETNDLFN